MQRVDIAAKQAERLLTGDITGDSVDQRRFGLRAAWRLKEADFGQRFVFGKKIQQFEKAILHAFHQRFAFDTVADQQRFGEPLQAQAKLAHQLFISGFFTGEIEIKRGLAQTARFNDIADFGAVIAKPRELGAGMFQQATAGGDAPFRFPAFRVVSVSLQILSPWVT